MDKNKDKLPGKSPEKKDLVGGIDWKRTVAATTLLTGILATVGSKYEASVEQDFVPGEIELGEVSRPETVQTVADEMTQAGQADQILADMGIEVDFGQEKVPEGWNEMAAEVQTDKLITFQTCGLEDNNPVKQKAMELINIGQDLSGAERSDYLKSVKVNFMDKYQESKTESEKELTLSTWLLFRNEYNTLLKAGSKEQAIEAAERGEMSSGTLEAKEYAEKLYESDYKTFINTKEPLIVRDADGNEVLELSPDSQVHQLIGGEDIINHVIANGGMEINNLADLEELDPVAYQEIAKFNLDKMTDQETNKIVEDINNKFQENNAGQLDKTDIDNIYNIVHKSLEKSMAKNGNTEKVKIPLTTQTATNPELKKEVDRSDYSVAFPEFTVGKYDVELIGDLLHKYQLFGRDISLPALELKATQNLSDAINQDGYIEINLAAKQDVLVGNISQEMLCQGNLVYVSSPKVMESDNSVAMPIARPSEKFNLTMIVPLIPLLLIKMRGKPEPVEAIKSSDEKPSPANLIPPKELNKKMRAMSRGGVSAGYSALGTPGGGFQYRRKKTM